MTGGEPAPLGASELDDGINFAVVARHADAVFVCLFDDSGMEAARFRLPERQGDVHFGRIAGAKPGLHYGLRASGPWAPEAGHRYDASKLLVDPYAPRLDRPFAWHPELAEHGCDTAARVPKAIVESRPPAAPTLPRQAPGFIYEVPVKALTMRHPQVREAIRGTVAALAEPCIVEHILQLGVDTVELMPLAAWIDERHLSPLGLANAWGYNPVTFLAPDPRLAPGGMAEVRETVGKLHAAGLRVVLDVVLNHSGESDAAGATLSLRGLDNALYYRHDGEHRLVNDTGCGNTLALDRPPVLRLAMDALRHWASATGIDGFRFDLATVMGRTERGFEPDAPLLAALSQDPLLATLILIAEPWDAGPGGYHLGGFPAGWHEWNDRYRDRVRRFWRADAHSAGDFATAITGSSDVFGGRFRRPSASVNFIAAHDGFTLADSVTFADKRNQANGEGNRDGHAHEISWVSRDPAAEVRPLLATLLLSRGTPMLTAGDEFGRTQEGNNNAYAQDNDVTWLDWHGADRSLVAFTGRLARLRRALAAIATDTFLSGHDTDGSGSPDAMWLGADGAESTGLDWGAGGLAVIGLVLSGAERVALWFNRGTEAVSCRLPSPSAGHGWRVELDSADEARRQLVEADLVRVSPRSVLVCTEIASAGGRRPAGASDAEVAALAAAAGIQAEWYEVDGRHHRVSPQTQRALLAAMHLEAATADDVRSSLLAMKRAGVHRALPMTALVPAESASTLPVVLPEAAGLPRLRLSLRSDADDELTIEIAPGDLLPIERLRLDGRDHVRFAAALPALPAGRYVASLDGAADVEAALIVHPRACHLPRQLSGRERRFGLAAHLYALRDERDAGIGDFETLARFGEATRAAGGVTAGINPLHHLFPTDRGRASPYQPSDRRFVDPIYLDLDAAAGDVGGPKARSTLGAQGREAASLRSSKHVDYARVWALKRAVLAAAFEDRAGAPLPELDRFIAQGGETLRRHGVFEALAERAGSVERARWPEPWRAPSRADLQHLEQENMREVRFHIFLQWLAERQLAAAQARGPVLGLYRDLALGVARDSGEVWARPDLFAASVSIGAPPDPFSAAGQNWQLPPFIPQALKRSGHAPVAEILRANMRAAGALRIDHVLGYARQFWIPAGAAGIDGAYVTYPADDLVALTALESTRARCLVIGEDLGTVPEGLRQRLAAAGILSCKVLWFERGADGAFLPPSSYPHLSAACLSSHDLVPFLGWTAAREPAGRRQLEAALERESIPSGATDADLMVAAHRMIARAPSTLMLVQADDLAGETEPLNVPGTDRERPNWRRRLKVTVEALAAEPLVGRMIGAVAEERSGTASATAPRA